MQAQYSLRNLGWDCKMNPHLTQKLDDTEIKKMFSGGGYYIRDTFNWDKPDPTSFWYVIKDSFGGIEELPSKVRNQVRKSLKCYEVKLVSPDVMYSDAFNLFNQSRRRFNDASLLVGLEAWRKRCFGGGQDFWLVYDRDTRIPQAFAINRTYDEYSNYVSMGVNPDAPSSTYPMYGLLLTMNQYYLEEKGLKYVCDGARTVTEHSNIQSFLIEKFKFRKAYCDLKVHYKLVFGLAIRALYPFRRIIHNKKLSAILNLEAMARGQM